jgi:hypothetical protein
MNDNFDVQEVRDGKVTDMRLECLIDCIMRRKWRTEHLDELFTELCREFIHHDAPTMIISRCGDTDGNASGLLYLVLLGFDFRLVHQHSEDWPTGGFPYLPDATLGVSISFDRGTKETYLAPGINVNQAAIWSIAQYMREKSNRENNQGSLPLN